MKKMIVGVDLAKNIIQVCVVKEAEIVSNDGISSEQFASWLALAKPAVIVIESCATSNYLNVIPPINNRSYQ